MPHDAAQTTPLLKTFSPGHLADRNVRDLARYAGPLSHARTMRSIELYGRKVIPLVREMLG